MLADIMKKLRGGGESAASLREARNKTKAAIVPAEQAVAAAQSERARMLLEGDDKQVLAAEARIDSARIAVDRLVADVDELEVRIAAAETREAEEALWRQIEEAEAAAAAAVARWHEHYEAAARQIETMVHDLTTAAAMVSEANYAALKAGKPAGDDVTARVFGRLASGGARGDLALVSLPRFRSFGGVGIARERAAVEGW